MFLINTVLAVTTELTTMHYKGGCVYVISFRNSALPNKTWIKARRVLGMH